MANNESGRGWARRAGSEVVDRLFLGNRAHDYGSGYWNKQGAIQGGIEGGASVIGGPLGKLAAKGGIWLWNKFNGGNTQGLNGSLASMLQNPAYQPNLTPNNLGANYTRGMTGGFNVPQPSGTLASMVSGRQPSPNLTPNNWQQSVWDQNLQQMQGQMDERLAAGGNAGPTQPGRYDASVAAMGGRSQGGGNGMGWTGVGGQQTRDQFLAGGYQAAQGVFSGMRNASDAAIRQAEYDAFLRSNRT